MKVDDYGQVYYSESELVDLLYQQPNTDLTKYTVQDPKQYNSSIQSLHLDWPLLKTYSPMSVSVEDFDHNLQSTWHMPDQYHSMDIAKLVLDQCSTEEELQRVGQELLLYQERNLFPLLCYLKYLVDTMKANQVVWGVGRGSSVSSYVLYLIGVHKINSLYYDLDIEEFLKG